MDAVSDTALVNRSVRALHAREQTLGLVASLAGALLLIWGGSATGAPAFAVPSGLALIGAGWALFAFVLFMRARFVRAQLKNRGS